MRCGARFTASHEPPPIAVEASRAQVQCGVHEKPGTPDAVASLLPGVPHPWRELMKRTLFVAVCCAIGLRAPIAHACGGFFCSTAPVDQSSERIVYGLEADGTLTMAVQIQYRGSDD